MIEPRIFALDKGLFKEGMLVRKIAETGVEFLCYRTSVGQRIDWPLLPV